MKLTTIISLMIITIMIGSCMPPESETYVSYIISNNSKHNVIMKVYKYNNQIDIINLSLTKNDTTFQGFQEGQVAEPPPFVSDSVRVFFDDSISIVHYRLESQTASRSILLSKSWTGGEIEEYKYKWEYAFTDDDYHEALENQ